MVLGWVGRVPVRAGCAQSWQTENIWFMSEAFNGTVLPAWSACAANLADCNATQLAVVQQYHAQTLTALAPLLNPSSPNGAFISSCLEHCQEGSTWSAGATNNGRTIADVVGAWYTGAASGAAVQVVMPAWPFSNSTTHC